MINILFPRIFCFQFLSFAVENLELKGAQPYKSQKQIFSPFVWCSTFLNGGLVFLLYIVYKFTIVGAVKKLPMIFLIVYLWK